MPGRATVSAGVLAALVLGVAAGCLDGRSEHRVRAGAYFNAGRYAEAVLETDRGLARDPGDVDLLIYRGKALFELERFDEARAAYEDALARGKEKIAAGKKLFLGDAYVGLAVVAARRGEWTVARDRYQDLLALNPHDASTHLNLARVHLFALSDPARAVEHGEQAARLRGDQEEVLFTLGKAYLAAGRLEEAERTFTRLGEVLPGSASAPYGLALVAARAGDRARALARLREAIERKVPEPDQITADPGFASLHADAEFRALVERARR